MDPAGFQFRQFTDNLNMYFMILDLTGELVWGPTKMTDNSTWRASSDPYSQPYSKNQVSATGDNHFLLAWQDTYLDSGETVSLTS